MTTQTEIPQNLINCKELACTLVDFLLAEAQGVIRTYDATGIIAMDHIQKMEQIEEVINLDRKSVV